MFTITRFMPPVALNGQCLAAPVALLLCVSLLSSAVSAEPPRVETRRFIYKKTPQRTLTLHLPPGWQPTDKRPAFVIFRCNIPEQREHFRQLGMVIVKPLLANVNSGKLPSMSLAEIAKAPTPKNQVEDAKSVIRYLRGNASKLGIDPSRIIATGTSGGGDLALQTILNTAFEDPKDDPSISHHPNGLVLYCPAFDGIDIWYVTMKSFLSKVNAEAPAFSPLLSNFVKNTTDDYATPIDHRAVLLQRADTLGRIEGIDTQQIDRFRQILSRFNQRDWQLLHPAEDALKMSASRILTNVPLPPTLIMHGTRDHLFPHQSAFIKKARAMEQDFEVIVYKDGGHSFMTQPAFEEKSTLQAERFLRKHGFITASSPSQAGALPRRDDSKNGRHVRDKDCDSPSQTTAFGTRGKEFKLGDS